MSGIEGGGEYVPEPLPEPVPQAPVEATPEIVLEPAPEPVAMEPVAEQVQPPALSEQAGSDADVLDEATAPEGRLDTARAEDAASRKISEELNARLSEAGVETAGETVAIGNLSNNPEHLAGELAAVREHGEQRAAFLEQQARAAEANEAQLNQDFADEADALEAEWRDREAAEAQEAKAQLDSESDSRIAEDLKRDELAAAGASKIEETLKLADIEDIAKNKAEIAEALTSARPQELVEQTDLPQDIPLPHQNEIHAADPMVTTSVFLAHLAQKARGAIKRS